MLSRQGAIRPRAASEPLRIGFVNNMPDAALVATERHFRELLEAAAHPRPIALTCFFLPGVPRGKAAIPTHYRAMAESECGALDALIVTGASPRQRVLSDEPYWLELAALVDWAAAHTVSTIWSCLAAHVAVLRLDGIERRPVDPKLSGLFDCTRAQPHPLLKGLPPRWQVPHSRYNGLDERLLAARGYRILSRGAEAGADLFVKPGASLFVFMQGHPEYEAQTLFLEYRRDIENFLAGSLDRYPEVPTGYFDPDAESRLQELRRRVTQSRERIDIAASLAEIRAGLKPAGWRAVGARLYANWLAYVDAHCGARGADPVPATDQVAAQVPAGGVA